MNAKKPLRKIVISSLSLSLVLLSGCVAVAAAGAGAASYAYVSGALKATLEEPVPRVQKASELALEELGFARIRSAGDELEAKVEYRTSQDKKVTVKTEIASKSTSDISIRVGTFGDENQSIRILEKIKEKL